MFTKLINSCQGRTTFFCMAFFIVGTLLHLAHRLDATYITFMGTILGFVLGHSVKEDHFGTGKNPADAPVAGK
jgi:hypothetical protein